MIWQPPVPRKPEIMRAMKKAKKDGQSVGPYILRAIRASLERDGYLKPAEDRPKA